MFNKPLLSPFSNIIYHIIDENSSPGTEMWHKTTLAMKGYNDMSVAAPSKEVLMKWNKRVQMRFAVIAIKL